MAVTVSTATSADMTADCAMVAVRFRLEERLVALSPVAPNQLGHVRVVLRNLERSFAFTETLVNFVSFPSAGIIRIRF
jgi:hypothetical protein